jgi:hypothetical protein
VLFRSAIEQALELARQEQEALEADVSYQLKKRDPFAAIGIDLQRYAGGSRTDRRATQQQLAYFRKAGLPTEHVESFSSHQAEALREALLERKAVGLCTPKQARQLAAQGIDPCDVYYDEARALLNELRTASKR